MIHSCPSILAAVVHRRRCGDATSAAATSASRLNRSRYSRSTVNRRRQHLERVMIAAAGDVGRGTPRPCRPHPAGAGPCSPAKTSPSANDMASRPTWCRYRRFVPLRNFPHAGGAAWLLGAGLQRPVGAAEVAGAGGLYAQISTRSLTVPAFNGSYSPQPCNRPTATTS